MLELEVPQAPLSQEYTMNSDNVLHTTAHKLQSGNPNWRPRSSHRDRVQNKAKMGKSQDGQPVNLKKKHPSSKLGTNPEPGTVR